MERAGVLGFAHRGAARGKGDQNSLPAFERALSLGAPGLETDIGLTADGVPVLLHPHLLRRGPRISHLRRHEIPGHIPSLADLYERCGRDFELSLDMAQPQAVEAVMRIAEEHGAVDRLWLTYWKLPTLGAWRRRWPHVHLVYPALPLGSGRSIRLIERLAAMRVDVLNVHHRLCGARLVERAHDRGLGIFAWGVHGRRPLRRLLVRGVDGVYCDDVAAMMATIRPPS